MADYKEILYEKQRRGVLVTLNRPEAMNAISRTIIKELHEALDEVLADPEIRAVVVTGAGRAFSAGMDQGKTAGGRRRDLHWPYGIPTGQSAAEVIDSWRSESRNFMRLWELPSPKCATAPTPVLCGHTLVVSRMRCATALPAIISMRRRHYGSGWSLKWFLQTSSLMNAFPSSSALPMFHPKPSRSTCKLPPWGCR